MPLGFARNVGRDVMAALGGGGGSRNSEWGGVLTGWRYEPGWGWFAPGHNAQPRSERDNYAESLRRGQQAIQAMNQAIRRGDTQGARLAAQEAGRHARNAYDSNMVPGKNNTWVDRERFTREMERQNWNATRGRQEGSQLDYDTFESYDSISNNRRSGSRGGSRGSGGGVSQGRGNNRNLGAIPNRLSRNSNQNNNNDPWAAQAQRNQRKKDAKKFTRTLSRATRHLKVRTGRDTTKARRNKHRDNIKKLKGKLQGATGERRADLKARLRKQRDKKAAAGNKFRKARTKLQRFRSKYDVKNNYKGTPKRAKRFRKRQKKQERRAERREKRQTRQQRSRPVNRRKYQSRSRVRNLRVNRRKVTTRRRKVTTRRRTQQNTRSRTNRRQQSSRWRRNRRRR